MSPSTLSTHTLSGALADAERAALLFDGELVVHRDLPAMQQLVALAARLVRECFGGDDPHLAQRHMKRDVLLAAAAKAQRRFGTEPVFSAAFAAAIEQAGVDTAAAGWDKRVLRVLPSGDSHAGGRHSSAHVHRDSWGSNLYAQVNWWAPIFPVEAGNTIVFYPAFWRRPIRNSSDTWSFETVRAARRGESGVEYPSAPVPLESVAATDAMPLVIEPGELLCFSAAHLHGGTDNRSGHIRFSIETRTLSQHDLHAGRGAPNIDGHGSTPRRRWFRRMRDGSAL